MRLPTSDVVADVKRQSQTSDPPRDRSQGQRTISIVAAVIVGLFFVALAVHFGVKFYLAKKRAKAGNAATGNTSIWGILRGRNKSDRGAYSSSLQDGSELSPSIHRTEAVNHAVDPERDVANTTTSTNANAANRNSTATVDRNTSVRSVMTLPAYSPDVREDERVLGREGERAGIDVVLELPESQNEEEARREEEMDSLYQIRVARRAEAAEREERRRYRREAREARARGDYAAAQELRARGTSDASESVATQLIAMHQAQNRERRVSSVQYADLGVARHDGSRLRANSSESDRRPLLDSAASFAETTRGSLSTDMAHRRGRSGSSVMSISSQGSDEDLSMHQRRPSDFGVVSLNHSRNNSVSPSMNDNAGDMGAQSIPTIDPPVYDDLALGEPPNYESPINPRAPQLPLNTDTSYSNGAPQLPSFERLPSIRINDESQRNTTAGRR